MTLATAAAATPVLLGSFAQGRVAQAEKDLALRLDHWQHAIGLMDPGILPTLTGMGFGRYPALYLWHSDSARMPGNFTIERELDKTFLRLGAGEAYYLDQIVHVGRSDLYTVEARVRFHGAQQHLRVLLCEKALLYSFRCNGYELRKPEQSPPGGMARAYDRAKYDRVGRHWPLAASHAEAVRRLDGRRGRGRHR